jgi:hypothetical protein
MREDGLLCCAGYDLGSFYNLSQEYESGLGAPAAEFARSFGVPNYWSDGVME